MSTRASEESIKVCCRFRPQSTQEQAAGGCVCVELPEGSETSVRVLKRAGEIEQTFTFDRVFSWNSSQREVYDFAARPVIEAVLEGFNGTVFAYGQTASGKTHTMEGSEDCAGDAESSERGVIPRMVASIFDGISDANESTQFVLMVSVFEIYNENIKDLLNPNNESLKIREDPVRGIYVENLVELSVGSDEEINEIMQAGRFNRAHAVTNMNEHSSRSHLVVTLTVEQKNLTDRSVKVGKLHLVDLAGSEKVAKTGASGKRLDEAKHINSSLSALGNVISALSDKHVVHVPYRDSKLTRVLQESLGGNSKTSLIITCSPSTVNAQETMSTFRFGQRAKMIKNVVRINMEQSAESMKLMVQRSREELHESQRHVLQLEQILISHGIQPPGRGTSDKVRPAPGGLRNIPEEPITPATEAELSHLRERVEELMHEISVKNDEIQSLRQALDVLQSVPGTPVGTPAHSTPGGAGTPVPLVGFSSHRRTNSSPSNSLGMVSPASPTFSPEPRRLFADESMRTKVDKMEKQIATLTGMYQKLIDQKGELDARVSRRDKTVAQLERTIQEEKKRHAEVKQRYDKLLLQCESLTKAINRGNKPGFELGAIYEGELVRRKSRIVKTLNGGVRIKLGHDTI
eukprot:TRINITY_DN3785_c0_g1_i1.p1 TRINITY_DN3785_c0_g1~~TRINITY_DN3785_c0_g1_i1.p1  ORF type:complete len:679 (+),score=126.98 TRINITY_DN3785_c0_g1_i1:144-2039(+)